MKCDMTQVDSMVTLKFYPFLLALLLGNYFVSFDPLRNYLGFKYLYSQNATGLPSCSKTAPNPDWLASVPIDTGRSWS